MVIRGQTGIQTGKSKQINLAAATLLIIRQLVLHHQKSNMFYLQSLRNSRPLKGSEWWFISGVRREKINVEMKR